MPLAWNSDNSSIPYSSASRARSVAKRQSATSSSLRNTPALIVVLLTSSARSTGARRLRRGSRKRQAWRERPVDSRAAPGSTPGHRIQGASMSEAVWFYIQGESQQGPVSREDLLSQLRRLPRETLVWREGLGDWQPAHELAELGLRPAP